MKKLFTFLFLCLAAASLPAFGQSRITGTVVDSKDLPVIGATVTVEGTALGTTTDRDGNFVLNNAPASGTLQISFIGYDSQTMPINNRTNFRIVLQESVQQLDELVVIGYGAAKKSDLTGSVARVKADEMLITSAGNPAQSLQGRVAGVAVMTNNKPGSEPTMRIRGSGSITAENEPLYVVDGFPLMTGGIGDLNSNDIESIEILKDASSAAIYGSRGANGVVLITTKKGTKGRSNLSVSGYMGIQSPERLVELLDRDQFIDFINDAYTHTGANPVYSPENPAPNYNTDWQKEIIKSSALVQDYSFSFDGANEQTSYFLSGGYYSQEGLVRDTGFDKYSARLKLDHKFKPWLTVGANVNFAYSHQDIYDNATGDIFRFGWPTMPVKNPDGSWYSPAFDSQHSAYTEGVFNPVWGAATSQDFRETNRLIGDLYAEVQLAKNLKFRTNFGMDLLNSNTYNYSGTDSPGATQKPGLLGSGGQGYYKGLSRITENMLTYSNTWDRHRLTATGVYSFQDYKYQYNKVSGSGFENDATGAWDMSLASHESLTTSSDKYDNTLVSFTARAAYAYDDKYLLTVTGRYDGSSRFGENNKWGFFPSVGLGWIVSQEEFLRNNRIISNLKLRASYGQTGNQEIPNYRSLALLDSENASNYVYKNTLRRGYMERLANPDLKWERTQQIDIGLDLSLWNRIDLTVDYYHRITNDLLYEVPIPTTSGHSKVMKNVGEVKNDGIEIGVNARILDGAFKWDMGVNFTYNKNEITELYGDVTTITVQTSSIGLVQKLEVGKPVNSLWARESAGIIRTDAELEAYKKIRASAQKGEEMYVDHNNSNSINTDDYIFLGSIEPKYFYGLNMNFSYKNFNLNLVGQGAFDYASISGADDNTFNQSGAGSAVSIGYSNLSNYLLYGENQLRNQKYAPSKYAYDRMWSESNPNGSFPRSGAQETYLSDRTNAHWSYFVLRNIRLSYDFSSLIKIKGVEGLTVYVNAQNYISWAKKNRGYNPENGDVSHPWAKIMMFGFTARF